MGLVNVTTVHLLPYSGPPTGFWYGNDPAWRRPFEATARRRLGDRLRVQATNNLLRYELTELTVKGSGPVDVTIVFDRFETFRHFGLPSRDMPEVRADPGAESKHRNADDSLCLYYPQDPPERRWRSELGLDVLLELVADHLFAELYWRQTGGRRGGKWVLNEAPHELN